ncbi:CinA family protein [Demequina flava]|uniref:CinA family protein n=1 Tax=Demequina flava TaxID=1095025 RepID=UPI0007866F32|nr:CinA family protein [Demequina flava]
MATTQLSEQARALVAAAVATHTTIGTAESLTGGQVVSALVEIPGASEVVRGGVVSYAVDLKHDLLDVPQTALDDPGPVSRTVATAMAQGAQGRLHVDLALATTGVAGPEPHGGQPVGTVWVSVAHEGGVWAREHHFDGDRQSVRERAAEAAMELAIGILESPTRMLAWKSGT